jgi:hypothetical protein
MKKSTKAALLSGLVFPGAGHLVTRSYYRAAALAASAMIAIYVIFTVSLRQALAVVDKISSGEVPLDSGSISDLVAATSNTADNRTVNIALIAFGLLWAIGIADSWRLGNAIDVSDAQA